MAAENDEEPKDNRQLHLEEEDCLIKMERAETEMRSAQAALQHEIYVARMIRRTIDRFNNEQEARLVNAWKAEDLERAAPGYTLSAPNPISKPLPNDRQLHEGDFQKRVVRRFIRADQRFETEFSNLTYKQLSDKLNELDVTTIPALKVTTEAREAEYVRARRMYMRKSTELRLMVERNEGLTASRRREFGKKFGLPVEEDILPRPNKAPAFSGWQDEEVHRIHQAAIVTDPPSAGTTPVIERYDDDLDEYEETVAPATAPPPAPAAAPADAPEAAAPPDPPAGDAAPTLPRDGDGVPAREADDQHPEGDEDERAGVARGQAGQPAHEAAQVVHPQQLQLAVPDPRHGADPVLAAQLLLLLQLLPAGEVADDRGEDADPPARDAREGVDEQVRQVDAPRDHRADAQPAPQAVPLAAQPVQPPAPNVGGRPSIFVAIGTCAKCLEELVPVSLRFSVPACRRCDHRFWCLLPRLDTACSCKGKRRCAACIVAEDYVAKGFRRPEPSEEDE